VVLPCAHRYLRASGDRPRCGNCCRRSSRIVDSTSRGTRFGIGVDTPTACSRRAPGYQLTWMDAKVGDWVVTPRRGKAVEINALWYNALRLLEEWSA
jgi:predicted glycogen debranching enzyme